MDNQLPKKRRYLRTTFLVMTIVSFGILALALMVATVNLALDFINTVSIEFIFPIIIVSICCVVVSYGIIIARVLDWYANGIND